MEVGRGREERESRRRGMYDGQKRGKTFVGGLKRGGILLEERAGDGCRFRNTASGAHSDVFQ